LALWLAACSGAPQAPGVTATRVLELSGLQPLANAVGLSPDGSLVVTGDFEADLIAREVPSGTERWKVRVKPRREQRRIDGGIFAIAFSGDGLTLATISGQGSLKAWSWPALTLRTSTTLSGGLEAMSPVSLALNRRGTRAAANSILGRVHVADIAKGREEGTFGSVAQAPG